MLGGGSLIGIEVLSIEFGGMLSINGDLMGGAIVRKFPSESSLRIVMSSSPFSTFTREARLS
jgi:hypothetical protein